jgi:hypothetical protein
VLLSLKTDVAADRFEDNARLGRVVLEDGYHIGGGGIVRSISNDAGISGKRIDLGAAFITGDEGNLVDLTRESADVEFDVTAGFLDALARGNRVLFRLRDASQTGSVARLAFAHSLRFEFGREGDRVDIVLYGGNRVGVSSGTGRDADATI